jgi:hypothetical protein
MSFATSCASARAAFARASSSSAAVLGGKRHPQQAEVGHAPIEVAGEGVLAVDGGRARLDLLVREGPHHLAHELLGLGRLEVHRPCQRASASRRK